MARMKWNKEADEVLKSLANKGTDAVKLRNEFNAKLGTDATTATLYTRLCKSPASFSPNRAALITAFGKALRQEYPKRGRRDDPKRGRMSKRRAASPSVDLPRSQWLLDGLANSYITKDQFFDLFFED